MLMKGKKYIIQSLIALAFAVTLMWCCGVLETETVADRVKAVCDGFSVAALLYISMGAILWVSTTGFFDIFSYAFKKGAHAIIPVTFQDMPRGYYEYKMEKNANRKERTHWFTLVLGGIMLVISLILTAVWYHVAG